MDTKSEARHGNHQMRRGNKRDTSRDMKLKLKWIYTNRETRHANHHADKTRKHTSHEPRHETKTKMDTKSDTRHANHQMTRGNTSDTSRDLRLKLKWIQSARNDMRITRRDE